MIPKFRAFIKNIEKVVSVQELNFKYEEMVWEGSKYTEVEKFKDIELLQFIGFKDKNGVDIFENDIVKVSYKKHSYISYITYEFGKLTIASEYIGKYFKYYDNPLDVIFEDERNDHSIEVIGNKYENGDLLK